MTRREDFNDGYAKCIADIAREIDAIEQDGGSAERAVHNIKAIIAASTWLSDSNVALLRATGKLDAIESVEAKKATARTLLGEPLTDPLLRSAIIPDVVIQDNTVDIGTEDDVELDENNLPIDPTDGPGTEASDKALIAANPENFAMWKEICAAGNMTLPYWDWLDAGMPTSMPEQIGTHNAVREYSVTWRAPTAAYAHGTIRAISAEDALMKAKVQVTGNRYDRPNYECDCDSMDPCDWISVEEDDLTKDDCEHVEWEQPKPRAGVLVKALNQILAVVVTSASDIDDPAMLRQALGYIEDFAREALNEAIPGGELNEPHTYDDERK